MHYTVSVPVLYECTKYQVPLYLYIKEARPYLGGLVGVNMRLSLET
jgi:hypothetical protein